MVKSSRSQEIERLAKEQAEKYAKEIAKQDEVRKIAAQNIGRGSEHDRENKNLLAAMDKQEVTYEDVADMLNATMNDINVNADQLSADTGLSPYLARVIYIDQLQQNMEGFKSWMIARALANFEAKANVAMALDIKPTTLSSKLKKINPIIDAILSARRTGKDVRIMLGNRGFTVHPDDEFSTEDGEASTMASNTNN